MFGGDFGNGEKKIFFFLHKVQKPSKVFFFPPLSSLMPWLYLKALIQAEL